MLLLAVAAAAPATASAARVTGSMWSLSVTGAPGERNQLFVTAVDDGRIVIRDREALTVDPGFPCALQADGSVRCDLYRPTIELRAGDGNDVVTVAGAGNWSVYGEEGDDLLDATNVPASAAAFSSVSLYGGPGTDRLIDGPAGSSLVGGPGPDSIDAAGGDDTIRDDDGTTPARDHYDGGPGRDDVSYANRDEGVTVRLGDDGSGGTGGEQDTLRGVEDADGGAGSDLLIGDDGPNRLQGGGFEPVRAGDRLIGGGGDDRLEGGSGHDRLFGGRGNDVLLSFGSPDRLDGGPGDDTLYAWSDVLGSDRVRCGSGIDFVAGPAAGVQLERDCDHITIHGLLVGAVRLAPGRDGVVLRVRSWSGWGSRLAVRVVRGGKRIGAGAWRLHGNQGRRITIPARAHALRGAHPVVQLVFSLTRRSRARGAFTMTL
jgi:Ca2+-binding RTX toxin-like protein